MLVKNLKELEKLVKFCRKQGLKSIKVGAFSAELGDLPKSKYLQKKESDTPQTTPTYSKEDMLYWSVQGEALDA